MQTSKLNQINESANSIINELYKIWLVNFDSIEEFAKHCGISTANAANLIASVSSQFGGSKIS
jgi:hypothetical protein